MPPSSTWCWQGDISLSHQAPCNHVQVAVQGWAPWKLTPSSPATTLCTSSSKPAAGPSSMCIFILVHRAEGLAVVMAWCHLGWVTDSSPQTALSENHRFPHAQAKLTSVSLTFSAINTHRVLVSGIKIHKSKAESMK